MAYFQIGLGYKWAFFFIPIMPLEFPLQTDVQQQLLRNKSRAGLLGEHIAWGKKLSSNVCLLSA